MLEPLEPYPGGNHLPWRCRCTGCGALVSPTRANISRGQGGCIACGIKVRAAKRLGDEDQAVLDMIHAETRLKYPMIRKPGSDKFERVSWDVALDRVARLMKDDRDKNFIAKNADGTTVNRWISTGFLAASATTNETAFCTYKVVRSTGMLVFDNQARV